MLTELKVSQFAIIDSIHIQFNPGLNILSGETGAGKSILIKSLALLMGAKSSNQDIRSNKDKATIEGAFELKNRPDVLNKLDEMGIEVDDETLIVRRVLQKGGKSKVYLNGHLSTVFDLRRIVFPLVTMGNPTEAPLVEITGQHENKDLMSVRYQMDVLDQYCGNLELREKVDTTFSAIRALQDRMKELEQKSQMREQQLDFLEFQINEIEALDLQDSEDEILFNQIKELKMQGQWQEWLAESLDTLNNSDRSVIAQLGSILRSVPDHPSLTVVSKQLSQASTILEDVAFSLQQLSTIENEQESSLESLEDRLNRIRKLQKKFGEKISDIVHSLEGMKKEHRELSDLSATMEQMEAEKGELSQKLLKLSDKLQKKRLSGAKLLAKEVNKELSDLNMKGLQFLIAVEALEEPNSTGQDRIVFRTKTGAKDEARDLSKAASGGELSRILLSLKQVIGANQHPRTFLFDEVDTGVSGPTAEKVGAKLHNLAEHQQVICVTHLPQVASFGSFHYYIEKQPTKDTVEMSVKLLKKKERVDEIARLISGEKLTKTSIAHAKKLLESTL